MTYEEVAALPRGTALRLQRPNNNLSFAILWGCVDYDKTVYVMEEYVPPANPVQFLNPRLPRFRPPEPVDPIIIIGTA